MAGIDIDWTAGNSAYSHALDAVNQGYAGAEKGYELGQKRATIGALQGIDLNSPDSVNAGVGNLVKANALEQAGALSNLSFTRYLRSQFPAWMQQFSDIAGGKGAPATQASSDAPPTADDHAMETMGLAKDAADRLLATPAADRPAAFAQVKADMLKRGIPEQAIDAAGADLSDGGLKSLSDHYGQIVAHAQHQMNPQGEAPPVPTAHPSNQWYNNVTDSPIPALIAGEAKAAGADIFSPMLETARAMAMPGIQAQADIAKAGPVAQATATATKGVDIAAAPVLAAIEAWKAGKIKDAELPAAIKLAEAQERAKASYEPATEPERDARGIPTGRVIPTTKARYAADVGDASAAGKPLVTRSPEQQQSAEAQHKTFQDNYAREGNAAAVNAETAARDKALATARLAQSAEVNPNNLTPFATKYANTLSAFGIPGTAAKANELATWKNMVADNLRSAIQVFPKNQSEMNAIEHAVAGDTMPGDAAALALTMNAAIHDQQAKYKQARIAYGQQAGNDATEVGFQDFYKDPQNGFYTGASIFANPVFKDLKYNGKPAVVVDPQSHWGYFMPYSSHPTAFRTR